MQRSPHVGKRGLPFVFSKKHFECPGKGERGHSVWSDVPISRIPFPNASVFHSASFSVTGKEKPCGNPCAEPSQGFTGKFRVCGCKTRCPTQPRGEGPGHWDPSFLENQRRFQSVCSSVGGSGQSDRTERGRQTSLCTEGQTAGAAGRPRSNDRLG